MPVAFPWGTLQDVLHRGTPASLATLREETEMSFRAIPLDTSERR